MLDGAISSALGLVATYAAEKYKYAAAAAGAWHEAIGLTSNGNPSGRLPDTAATQMLRQNLQQSSLGPPVMPFNLA